MVTTTKMQTVAKAKTYYTKENYYQDNSEKGYFYSNSDKLLDILGLSHNLEVDVDSHLTLIEGFNPKTNEALANNAGMSNRRAGCDITSSSPKSFSILCEYARANGQDEFLNLLKSIQKEANLRMMSEATKYALTRLSDEKRTRINNVDVVWASFDHDTARVSKDGFIDPQEHTHNFLYNIVGYTDENGNYKIASLENKQMMQMQKYLGNFYRNEMSKLLIENGFEIELKNAKDGEFDIKGFSKEQLSAFSNRSKEIRAEAQALIDNGEVYTENLQKAIEIARLKNYKAKTKIDRDELTVDNKVRLELEGINDDFVSELIENFGKKEVTLEMKQLWLKRSYEHLAETKGIFSLEDLKMEFSKQSVHCGVSLNEVDELITLDEDIVKLEANKYTSSHLIKAEKEIIFNCLNNESFIIDEHKDRLTKYLEDNKIEFTAGQKEACELVMTSKKQFIAIQGDAGSGKTFSLGTLKKVYEKEFDFVGLAPTGQASENIGKDANVQYKTIDSYILQEIKRTGKPRIILLDETGMVDSIKLHKLLELAVANGDKVVLIGDTKQYASIGAGKIFEDLQKYGIEKANVTENKRQETDELRTVVDNIKNKNIEEAFQNLQNNVIEDKSEKKLLAKMVAHYDEETVILAPMNKQRNVLNLMVREKRLSQKLISDENNIEVAMFQNAKPNAVEKYSAKAYEIGQILSIDSTQIRGFKAGQKFTVVGIKDDETLILDTISTNKTGRDRTRKGIEFNIKENIDNVSIFNYDENNKLKFAENEKIILTRKITVGKTVIPNGAMGVIKKIDGDFVTLALNNKKEVSFNLRENPFMDYSYAITDYKSQGMSIKKVLVLGDKMMANLNAFYVQVTRAKQFLKFYTTDLQGFMERAKNEQVKQSTLDYTMREDFKELEKKEFKSWKNDLLEKLREDREKIKFNIKELINGKSNNANATKNEYEARVDREAEYTADKLSAGARQKFNELVSSVSSSLRRTVGQWRESITQRVKENWSRYSEYGSSLEAVSRIKDIQKINAIDKNKAQKSLILSRLGIKYSEKPILSIYNEFCKNNNFLQKDIIDKVLADVKSLEVNNKVKVAETKEVEPVQKAEKQAVTTKEKFTKNKEAIKELEKQKAPKVEDTEKIENSPKTKTKKHKKTR